MSECQNKDQCQGVFRWLSNEFGYMCATFWIYINRWVKFRLNKSQISHLCNLVLKSIYNVSLLFIGSIIFLTIEGGSVYQYQQILATTANTDRRSANHSVSSSLTDKNDKARAKTVENIWEITYSLNILYRDNWTRYVTRMDHDIVFPQFFGLTKFELP